MWRVHVRERDFEWVETWSWACSRRFRSAIRWVYLSWMCMWWVYMWWERWEREFRWVRASFRARSRPSWQLRCGCVQIWYHVMWCGVMCCDVIWAYGCSCMGVAVVWSDVKWCDVMCMWCDMLLGVAVVWSDVTWCDVMCMWWVYMWCDVGGAYMGVSSWVRMGRDLFLSASECVRAGRGSWDVMWSATWCEVRMSHGTWVMSHVRPRNCCNCQRWAGLWIMAHLCCVVVWCDEMWRVYMQCGGRIHVRVSLDSRGEYCIVQYI